MIGSFLERRGYRSNRREQGGDIIEPTQSVMEELRATLWRRVGDATHASVDELAIVFDGLARAPGDDVLRERGVRLAHAIAGSSGVYGFRDEARAASELEGLLRAWPGADGVAPARELLKALEDGFQVDA